jgi:hypothetical protein
MRAGVGPRGGGRDSAGERMPPPGPALGVWWRGRGDRRRLRGRLRGGWLGGVEGEDRASRIAVKRPHT